MMIPLNTVKKIMQTQLQNGRPVSTKAVFLMAQKIESFIAEKTKQAEEKLKEENKLRGIQGLPERKRINEELLNEVL